MSKLIRDKESGKETDVVPALLPLSNSTVVAHLKSCQKLAADHARSGFKHYIKVLDEVFSRQIDHARSDKDATLLGEVQRNIRRHSDDLEKYFCGYISEGFVKFKKGQLNTNIGDESEEANELSLVGNEDLEEAIAITSLTQRADGYFAEPLWALNQRFAVLNGGEHVTESSNPAAPIQICESLRRALQLLKLTIEQKIIIYKVFDTQLLNLSRLVVEDINHYLKSQGILPNLKYTLPTGSVPASYFSDDNDHIIADAANIESRGGSEYELPDPNLPPEQYQSSLLDAIRGLQNQLLFPGGQTPLGNYPEGATPVSEADLMHALQSMQMQYGAQEVTAVTADGQPLIPVDITVIARQLQEQLKQEDKEGPVEKNDMQTIDLVGMLFEYMLNDEHLPDSVKALLSYLHTPFLKIAFIDPGFFEKHDHPARLLLNNLAEAASRWVGNDGTSQYGIFEKIKEIVNRVLKDFESDVKIITELLLEFSSYTKNIVRRQELMEKRATEKAQGEEKLREVKLRVNDEVRSRTRDKELPSSVLLFLLQPWTDFLSFSLLRYGEKSENWQKAIALVDDLLWCINPQVKAVDKSRQKEMYDALITQIEVGFSTIGFDPAKGKKLKSSLSSLIKMALQSKKAEPAPAPVRDELEKIAAEKAGEKLISPTDISEEEAKMVESLKMIEFGTWFEFKSGKRLKVAWCNARTSHYMLVNQMGKREDMISGINLARMMISKEAKIISGSSKPFFERALENIFQKLNEKAGAPDGSKSVAETAS